jgi:hypothetical protein
MNSVGRLEGPLLITLDTNQLRNAEWLEEFRSSITVAHELAVVSVTARERGNDALVQLVQSVPETAVWGESNWDQAVWAGDRGPILESFVVGESLVGEAMIGGGASEPSLEELLDIIADGGFPAIGKRDQLTKGHRNQLRDAMILQAHSRAARNVLVSDDTQAYVSDGRRERLESLCQTRILTRTEFLELARAHLLPSLRA